MKRVTGIILLITFASATAEPSKVQTHRTSIHCLGCAIQAGKLETIGGLIAETKYFEAHQDYSIPIPGFIILASKRHIQSIDEFTAKERHDFIDFSCHIRQLMRKKLGVDTVYFIQEEDANHFHVWLFPRYDWMKQFGDKIKSVKPIMNWAQKNLNSPNNLVKVKEAAEKLAELF